jgi:hypothetical protein
MTTLVTTKHKSLGKTIGFNTLTQEKNNDINSNPNSLFEGINLSDEERAELQSKEASAEHNAKLNDIPVKNESKIKKNSETALQVRNLVPDITLDDNSLLRIAEIEELTSNAAPIPTPTPNAS